MKNIIYIIDSLSPLALKSLSKKFYNIKNNKFTYFDKLINKSILVENIYGHGETYSTIFAALTGENVYKNNCDSWYLENSFKKFSNFGSLFKKKGFTNIYLRNASPSSAIDNFYGRFLSSISKDFDYKLIKKQFKRDTFSKYIQREKKLYSLLKKGQKKFFILIHDYTLHDSKDAYNGNTNKILKVINKNLTKNFRDTLSKINYDKKKDNLIVFSDHGLTVSPESNLYTQNSISKKQYDQLYKNIFLDEKIKMLFFINSPKINKKKMIKGNYQAKDLYSIIHNFFKNNQNLNKFLNFAKKQSKKNLITSVRSTRATIYENYYEKNNFHNHIIYIKNRKKFVYSNKHEVNFIEHVENKFFSVSEDKVDKNFKLWINDYFTLQNRIKKYILFTKYKINRLFTKFKIILKKIILSQI